MATSRLVIRNHARWLYCADGEERCFVWQTLDGRLIAAYIVAPGAPELRLRLRAGGRRPDPPVR